MSVEDARSKTRAVSVAFRLMIVLAFAVLSVAGVSRLGSAQESTPSPEESTPVAIGTPTVQSGDDTANVALVHASADVGPVDIYIDGEPVAQGVEFGAVSEFLTVESGEHTIQVVPAGGDVTSPAVEATVDFSGGTTNIAVVAGPLAELEVATFEMLLEPVEGDNVRTRAIHAASGLGAVDVAAVGGDVIFGGLEYLEASDHSDQPAGLTSLELRDEGQENPLAPFPQFEAQPGTVVEMIITQDEESAPHFIYVGASAEASSEE